MNIWLQDFKKNLTILGFKDARIPSVNVLFEGRPDKPANANAQFLDAGQIAGADHLRFAALNAMQAFKQKINISYSLSIEILLYASAQYQIKRAVQSIGVKSTTTDIAVLIIAGSNEDAARLSESVSRLLMGERDDSVLDLNDAKMKRLREFFGVSKVELGSRTSRKGDEKAALTDLIIERMALLATQR